VKTIINLSWFLSQHFGLNLAPQKIVVVEGNAGKFYNMDEHKQQKCTK
jgi:hypothetical protein